MQLIDRIERLEKAVVEHYINIGERRKGWTILANLKSHVDYTCDNEENWEIDYFKELSDKVDELKIRNLIKQ